MSELQAHRVDIAANLARVRERMATAARQAGRQPDEVTLVAVSKLHPAASVIAAARAGQRVFGENRVQEALDKMAQVPADLGVTWHLVGHLQRNKARHVPGRFALVHSVDGERLARALAHHTQDAGVVQDVLVQVNFTGEAGKAGVPDPDTLRRLLEALRTMPALNPRGLMTIPDPDYDEARTRSHFAQLRALVPRLREELGLGPAFRELSMGMTHDFEWAIAEGATIVRVGTAIFGERPT